ncbi:MAG: hypothetical protein K0R18_260 [Bacillales bacterium]|jgi:hypothetical protein|nr:hypothetical protein [Bacillales bacterium]
MKLMLNLECPDCGSPDCSGCSDGTGSPPSER